MVKKENPKKNKHLTPEDRRELEECLSKRMTFKAIEDDYADIRNNFTIVSLPPYSPDLNPIEQVWRVTRREKTGICKGVIPKTIPLVPRGLIMVEFYCILYITSATIYHRDLLA